ncbi:MAG: hypothetical protein LH470_09630 [Lysobacter sp.]|nr:hypothetical protein [Lysobacter sp.]
MRPEDFVPPAAALSAAAGWGMIWTHPQHSECVMSKGMDQKKTEKKKPEKNLKEKRAAKKDKKAGK